jgi:hypothetical protein
MGPGWHDEGEGRPTAEPRGGRRPRLRRPPAAGRRPHPNEARVVETLSPGAGSSRAGSQGAPPDHVQDQASDAEALAQGAWGALLQQLVDHDAALAAERLDRFGRWLRGGWERLVVPRLASWLGRPISRRGAGASYLAVLALVTLLMATLLCCGGRVVVGGVGAVFGAGSGSSGGTRGVAIVGPAGTASTVPAITATTTPSTPSPATSPLVPTPTDAPKPTLTPIPPPPAALAGNITVANENDVAINMMITVRGGQWYCGNTLNGQWQITIAPRATSAIHCVIFASQYATPLPQSLLPRTFDTELSQGSPPRWIHYYNPIAFTPCSGSVCAGGHMLEQGRDGRMAESRNPLARKRSDASPPRAAPMRSQTDAGFLLRSTQRMTPLSANTWAGSSTAGWAE